MRLCSTDYLIIKFIVVFFSLFPLKDRSWARRARGQSRRGDLLNADFSGDRERPSSPSPLAENKPFLQEEETKPTGYDDNNPTIFF